MLPRLNMLCFGFKPAAAHRWRALPEAEDHLAWSLHVAARMDQANCRACKWCSCSSLGTAMGSVRCRTNDPVGVEECCVCL